MSELKKKMVLQNFQLIRSEPDLGLGSLWGALDTRTDDWVWLEILELEGRAANFLTPFLSLVGRQKALPRATSRHVVPVLDVVSAAPHFGVALQSTQDPRWRQDWKAGHEADPTALRTLFEAVCRAFDENASSPTSPELNPTPSVLPPGVHGGFSAASVVRWSEGGQRSWRVMDFGLACLARPRVPKGVPGCVEDYFAPEIVGHVNRATPKSDVFALGVFLAELLTGRTRATHEAEEKPWHIVTLEGAEIAVQTLAATGPAEAPDELWQVMAKTLDPNPHDRPNGPMELLAILRPVLLKWEAVRNGSRPAGPRPAVRAGGEKPTKDGPDLVNGLPRLDQDGHVVKAPQGAEGPMPIKDRFKTVEELRASVPSKRITERNPASGVVDTPPAGPTASPVASPTQVTLPVPAPALQPPPIVVPSPPTLPSPTPPLPSKPPEPPPHKPHVDPSLWDTTAWDAKTGTYSLPQNRYHKRQPLGRGKGEFLAWDERTATNVHLKMLTPRQVSSLRSFYEPAWQGGVDVFPSMARDHVVRVLDLALDERYPYLVTEALEAQSLDDYIKALGRPLEPSAALTYLGSIVSVLKELARRSDAHGDLRPDNLLIARVAGSDVLKVAGCGLAHPETSPMVSPEQLDGGRASPSSDIWALGLIVFQMLTGQSFWVSPEDREQLRSQIHGKIPGASSRGRVPDGFDDWFARCLRQDARPFRSAEDAYKDLQRIIAGPRSRTTPVASVTPAVSAPVGPGEPIRHDGKDGVRTGLMTVRSVAVTSNGRWLMAGGIPPRHGQQSRNLQNEGGDAAGKNGGAVRVWALDTKDPISLEQYEGCPIDTVYKVTASGSYLATSSVDGRVCYWNFEEQDFGYLTQHKGRSPIDAVAVACDPALLVVAAGARGIPARWTRGGVTDRVLKALAADNGHRGAILDLAIAHDRTRVVTAGMDNELAVWDLRRECRVGTLLGHTRAVQCVALDHQDPVALSGSRDHTVRLWSLDTSQCTRTYEGHTDAVNAVAFVPGRGGSEALSASSDGTIRHWDIASGRCLAVYAGHVTDDGRAEAAVWSVACINEETFISGGSDGWIRFWHL